MRSVSDRSAQKVGAPRQRRLDTGEPSYHPSNVGCHPRDRLIGTVAAEVRHDLRHDTERWNQSEFQNNARFRNAARIRFVNPTCPFAHVECVYAQRPPISLVHCLVKNLTNLNGFCSRVRARLELRGLVARNLLPTKGRMPEMNDTTQTLSAGSADGLRMQAERSSPALSLRESLETTACRSSRGPCGFT